MPLGYRNNPDWRDLSAYVVHFTSHVDVAFEVD